MSRHHSLSAAFLSTALAVALVGAIPATASATPATILSAPSEVQPRSGAQQSTRLLMHPQISQPGKGVRKAKRADSAMTAVLRPRRAGRAVVLQRQRGHRWVTVRHGRESRRGVVEFTAPFQVKGKTQTYRAVAKAYRDLRTVRSKSVATSMWGPADFTDQFSGKSLGGSWSNRLQGYSAASLRKCSKASPRAVRVKKGALRLRVLNDPDRGGRHDPGKTKCRYEGKKYQWRLNGSIGTQGAKSFRYGYAAARMKFQPRRGQHAAFWLQPESRAVLEGSAKKTGSEIDVIEWFGNHQPQGGLASFVYNYPDDGKPGVTSNKIGGFLKNPGRFGGGWAKRYHVFSVEWTPRHYVFRIDGKETFRTSKGVSGRHEYLILSVLSSDYELPLLGGERRLPQTSSVDWVRYWER